MENPERGSPRKKIAQLEARNQEKKGEKDQAQIGNQRRRKEATTGKTPQEERSGAPLKQSSQAAVTNVPEGSNATPQPLQGRTELMTQKDHTESSPSRRPDTSRARRTQPRANT